MSIEELPQVSRACGPIPVTYVSHWPRRSACQSGSVSGLKCHPHKVRASADVSWDLTEPYRSVEAERKVWQDLFEGRVVLRFGVVMELIEIQTYILPTADPFGSRGTESDVTKTKCTE